MCDLKPECTKRSLYVFTRGDQTKEVNSYIGSTLPSIHHFMHTESHFKMIIVLMIIVQVLNAQESNNSYLIGPWNMTNVIYCQKDNDCEIGAVCLDGQCRCAFGISDTSQCRIFTCTTDDQCSMIENTRCNGDICICDEDYYLDWFSQTCQFSYLSTLEIIERLIPIIVAIIILLLLATAVTRCYIKRRRRSEETLQPSVSESNISTLLSENLYSYYDHLIINNQTAYPPPPPYSEEYSVPELNVTVDMEVHGAIGQTLPPPYTVNKADNI